MAETGEVNLVEFVRIMGTDSTGCDFIISRKIQRTPSYGWKIKINGFQGILFEKFL
ncbi:MAG: hypothetical protein ACOCVA_00025 [Prolixibacteraceae bacterium]